MIEISIPFLEERERTEEILTPCDNEFSLLTSFQKSKIVHLERWCDGRHPVDPSILDGNRHTCPRPERISEKN
ncbi:MAG: hypothetical protein A2156_15100 [Deltaproteobacteria bacterium RBG_16_48_10]|nr:MAG: hypothetical protein A2156_15100 [Deltaproteobacteria bacterium RBG_16_48_10]